MKTNPLHQWMGTFGNEYISRNKGSKWKTQNGIRAFGRMLDGIRPRSVLEIGSNIGLNLLALRQLLGPETQLYALEPNRSAYECATSNRKIGLSFAWNTDASRIPAADDAFDLVFTSGVLIHIPPPSLFRVTSEIVRVARKWVLCAEYFSHTPVEIPYRGHHGLLFKRDFGSFYLDNHPCLRALAYGFLWQRELRNFDNLNWWLFRKVRSRRLPSEKI